MTLSKDTPAIDPIEPTIFHQPWWLNAASGGNYREVTVTSGSRIIGRFPFVLVRMRGGGTLCRMPELTHCLGPAVDDGRGSAVNRALRRGQITRELLRLMPPSSSFFHKMHSGVSDMLAFQENLYDISVQFTYEITPAPEHVLWQNMRDKTRNVIRRAKEQMSVSDIINPDEFISIYNTNLYSRGLTNKYNNETIERVCCSALRQNQGRIIAARHPDGHITAAIFYVWDLRAAYYLMSTRTNEAGNGAVSLLLWEAIVDSTSRGLIFDFDGIGTHGSINFIAGFGGYTRPRYIALRHSSVRHILSFAARALQRKPLKAAY